VIINCGALLTGAAPTLRSTGGALLTALYRQALYWRPPVLIISFVILWTFAFQVWLVHLLFFFVSIHGFNGRQDYYSLCAVTSTSHDVWTHEGDSSLLSLLERFKQNGTDSVECVNRNTYIDRCIVIVTWQRSSFIQHDGWSELADTFCLVSWQVQFQATFLSPIVVTYVKSDLQWLRQSYHRSSFLLMAMLVVVTECTASRCWISQYRKCTAKPQSAHLSRPQRCRN